MPNITGKIDSILVGEAYGKVVLNPDTGSNRTFVLWSSWFTGTPDAADRIYHSNLLALSRDALLHNKEVVITHNTDSAVVTSMQVLE